MTQEESPIMFRCREIQPKKSELRSVPLIIGSPGRDATDNLVPTTMGGGSAADQPSRHVAIEVMQAMEKKKLQWQDVPLPPKGPKRRKTGAK
ncbi:hypothetical protein R1flu_014486 [Riccia fluitans]|uniref:Uncharacterized protein n=1 Tax=Riccia fluitans TaxID=41844 RepID=A0ABD1YGZ0_9MARC